MAYDNEEPSAPENDKPDEKSPPRDYLPDVNLVSEMKRTKAGKAALKRIHDQINDDWDTGWASTEPFRQRTAKDWDLVAGNLPQKDAPFEGCANIHVPTTLENIERLRLRMMEEIFGDWSNIFGVVPIGAPSDAIADVLTLHGNWQLREQIRDFQRQMHRATFAFLFIGDVTGKSSFDPLTNLNRHDTLTPDDFVVPYTSVTTQPDYSDVPWTAQVLRLYRHDLEARIGDWEDVDRVLDKEPPSFADEPDEPLAEHATASSEQDIDEAQRVKPYKLIEYDGYLELPGEERLRFCQVIFNTEGGHILSLKIHEEENWQDRIRFDHQTLELAAYQEAQHQRAEQLMQLQDQQSQIQQADDAGQGGPLNNMAMMGDLNQAMAIPEVPQPDWLMDSPDGQPEPVRMDPIRMYVHAVCIEPMKGNLGLSYGRMQADNNRAINTMLDQFVDSATLANVPCYIGTGLKFQRDFQFKPGHFNMATGVSPEELKNAIIPFTSQGPSAALFQTVEFLIGTGQSSMQSNNVLSGEPGKSGEPARGLASRLEQASKQLGTVARKFVSEFLTPIVKNNAALNARYLREEELFEITNAATGMAGQYKVRRDMYARNYSVVFRADMRFTSQTERVMEADEALKMVLSIPYLQTNAHLAYAAVKKSFQARGLYEFIRLMGDAPQGPPPPFGMPPQQPPQGEPGQAPGQPPGGPGQGGNVIPMQQGAA